jgi:hypothetical protein
MEREGEREKEGEREGRRERERRMREKYYICIERGRERWRVKGRG